jgi:hypothetical protein
VLERLAQHVAADKREQRERDPVVVAGDEVDELPAPGPSQYRHDELCQSEGERRPEHLGASGVKKSDAAADRHRETVGRKTQRCEDECEQRHDAAASDLRMVLTVSAPRRIHPPSTMNPDCIAHAAESLASIAPSPAS